MKITTREEGEVTIVSLDGRLVFGQGDVLLRDEITGRLEQGDKKILIDLGRVRAMDSTGLGELVQARTRAAEAGAEIKLLHVEDKVQDVLEMTRLIGVFESYDELDAALASFRG